MLNLKLDFFMISKRFYIKLTFLLIIQIGIKNEAFHILSVFFFGENQDAVRQDLLRR